MAILDDVSRVGSEILKEKTVYDFWSKLWNGESKKTKLIMSDTNGKPIINEVFEFPATIGFSVSQSATMGTNKSENRRVYTESITSEPETISISGHIHIPDIPVLNKYLIPGNLCFIKHWKSIGGARNIVEIDDFFAKQYQLTSLTIDDEGYINSVAVKCEFVEVLLYEIIQGQEFIRSSNPAKVTDKGKQSASGEGKNAGTFDTEHKK